MDDMQQGISASVRALAAWKRDTQADLGRLLGLSTTTVAHRLNGRLAWTLQDVEALCKHYGVTLQQLTGGPETWLNGATNRYQSGFHPDDLPAMAA